MKFRKLTTRDFDNADKEYRRGELTVNYYIYTSGDKFFAVDFFDKFAFCLNAKLTSAGVDELNTKLEELFESLGERNKLWRRKIMILYARRMARCKIRRRR